MTTQVMQQALDALERNVQHKYPLQQREAIALGQTAIDALREAIAAHEIAALKAAQPVEEMATPYITQEQIERAFPDTPTPPAKPPEALRLASWLCEGAWHSITLGDVEAAGRELRRLHALTTTKPAPAAPYQLKDELYQLEALVDIWFDYKRNMVEDRMYVDNALEVQFDEAEKFLKARKAAA